MLKRLLHTGAFCLALLLVGCATQHDTASVDFSQELHGQTDPQIAKTIARFRQRNDNAQDYLSKAYGYAVFPTVGKGALIVGGAYGTGKVYEQHHLVGLSSITQATIGLQLGGATYSEIVFFKSKQALRRLQQGDYTVSAQASAISLHSGASADANYNEDVIIFIMNKAGLMAEASLGIQKFTYTPVE